MSIEFSKIRKHNPIDSHDWGEGIDILIGDSNKFRYLKDYSISFIEEDKDYYIVSNYGDQFYYYVKTLEKDFE